MEQISAEISRCKANIKKLNEELQDTLSTFIAGQFHQLEDEHLAAIATALSSWLADAATTHLHAQTMKLLLLMEYWHSDIERLERQVNFTKPEIREMIQRLEESYLMKIDGSLKHPWYDAAGTKLNCEIAIYAAVMLNRFKFTPGRDYPEPLSNGEWE